MLNQIHHGDCLELMQHLSAGSVDMILCDLPYGTTACKWDTIIPFDKLWAQYKRIIKPNGAIVLTASQPFTSALVMSNAKQFRHEWIWNKVRSATGLNATRAPLKTHESVLVFSYGPPSYTPQITAGKPFDKTKYNGRLRLANVTGGGIQVNKANEGTRFPVSIQTFSQNWSRQQQQHPTQKPVALFEYLIRTYTHPGEVVLDNCAGSGTTAVAAENTGRRWICMEQEEKYVTIARARVASLQTTFTF